MKKILVLANFDVGLYKFRKELLKALLDEGNEVYISLPDGTLVRPLEEMGCIFVETDVDRRGVNPFVDYKLILQYYKLIKKIYSPHISEIIWHHANTGMFLSLYLGSKSLVHSLH